jgi:hypothetical protein
MTSEAFAMGSDLQHEAILPACRTACVYSAATCGPAPALSISCVRSSSAVTVCNVL